ncbi:Y-family DNA polymerase [Novosphingobium sp. 2580]|uniref:DNA-directed DNA polymerase n=2 Tax=Sphingomonadaceae TaxID=41297 RepID=A0ABT0B553_9SPHN|nr:Y-family DNA polymerase [Novosphingobium album (ex Hu et al. 2023)]
MDLSLRDRPTIVASNNDGCTVARSPEAKALGIKMGDPLHLIADKIREHGILVRSSNYTLYGDVQRRVLAATQPFARDIEVYSVDENFLDLSGFEHLDLTDHCQKLRARILQWTTIPTCVGIGPTKTLAKLANAAAKKNPLFDGVADLRDESIRRYVMERFDIADVWGIGASTARKLGELGVRTAGELRDMPMRQARGLGTVVLERLVAELNGVQADAVEVIAPPRRGMAVTRSFGRPITDREDLMGAIAQFAMRAGEKLRSHRLVAGRVTVFFHTNRFKPERPQFAANRSSGLHPMTADSLELINAARALVEHCYRDGYAYTKAGIMLEQLVAEDDRPPTLFEDAGDRARRRRLMEAVDSINGRFGRMTIVPGTQGFKRPWKVRADLKSPAWTTRIKDLPIVSAAG